MLVRISKETVPGERRVVNPRARTDRDCPIYGMPILNAIR